MDKANNINLIYSFLIFILSLFIVYCIWKITRKEEEEKNLFESIVREVVGKSKVRGTTSATGTNINNFESVKLLYKEIGKNVCKADWTSIPKSYDGPNPSILNALLNSIWNSDLSDNKKTDYLGSLLLVNILNDPENNPISMKGDLVIFDLDKIKPEIKSYFKPEMTIPEFKKSIYNMGKTNLILDSCMKKETKEYCQRIIDEVKSYTADKVCPNIKF
jgi:hypothetical protein